MRSLLVRLNRPVVAVAAVALIAGGLRFVHLGYPPSRVFDEVYYSKSGCVLVGYSNERCDIVSGDEKYWVQTKGETGSWVHPPLGKWAIGLGEKLFGTGSFGWRVSAAVFGTASVVLLAIIAQLLFGSPLWTFVTGLLLATESLNFVQSRTSMLDIFVTSWIVLGLLLLLLDRRWIERRTPTPAPPEDEDPEPDVDGATTATAEAKTGAEASAVSAAAPPFPSPIWRPWRIAAGVALGAALATKWSGLPAIAGAVLLSLLWERTRRKRSGISRPLWRAIQREGFGNAVSFLVIPGIVYVSSYAGWFVHFGSHWSAFLPPHGAWWKLQGDMLSYSIHLKATNASGGPVHPYLSPAWKWLLLWRPVLFYAKYPSPDLRHTIIDLGNPAIFWSSLLTIPYLAFAWRRRRDWRAGFVLVAILAQYLPWFVVTRPQFLFYVTPVTPFLVLAVTSTLKPLSEARVSGSRSRPYLPIAVGFVVVSVGLFFFFWPVLTAGPISTRAWQLRVWFKSWV